jgi:uncharacterized cupin superfamily protein
VTWEAPKTFVKGIIVPDEVRAVMKEGDKLGLQDAEGVGHWFLNGQEVHSAPIAQSGGDSAPST